MIFGVFAAHADDTKNAKKQKAARENFRITLPIVAGKMSVSKSLAIKRLTFCRQSNTSAVAKCRVKFDNWYRTCRMLDLRWWQGGKGSHRKFRHPKVAGSVIVSGKDGDDAHHYQEKQVRNAIREASNEAGRQIS